MKRLMISIAGLGMLATLSSAVADKIDVMTQNQYVGTDLIGLVNSDDFNAAVIEALQDRAASLPTERVQALARLIDQRGPEVVGLQEVYKFTCVDTNPADFRGCEHQSISGAFTDQLADTLAALGGQYEEAATVVNIDLPAGLGLPIPLPGIPISFDATTIYVGVVDRDVILARSGLQYTVTNFAALNALDPQLCSRPSADGCNFDAAAEAPLEILGMPVLVRFERGFVGIDVVLDGKSYRFANTHLETKLGSFGPQGRVVQAAQSAELLATLEAAQYVAPSERLLAVGDFNSGPTDEVIPVPSPLPAFLGIPPYQQLLGVGFTDAWTIRPGASTGQGAPLVGFSCCQDDDLGNHKSDLTSRIDLVFSIPMPSKVKQARLLGESVSDKTPPKGHGLWPSDHASVATELQFKE